MSEKDEINTLLRVVQEHEMQVKMLSHQKAAAVNQVDTLKQRVLVLEKQAAKDASVQEALLLVIGAMRRETKALSAMANSEEASTDDFLTAAMEVLAKITDSLQLDPTGSEKVTNVG